MATNPDFHPRVILVTSAGLGSGEPELGKLLLANFLRLLGEGPDLPQEIVFVNTGVSLLAHHSPMLEHLKKLEERGVALLACRTCVEYLDLEDKLAAGSITTMAVIKELLLNCPTLTL